MEPTWQERGADASYVNIRAYVDERHHGGYRATVGSCAQIGKGFT